MPAKLDQLRDMGPEALLTLEREQREKIFKLRFQHSLGQLDSPASARTAKRDLARTLTIAAERRRGEKADRKQKSS